MPEVNVDVLYRVVEFLPENPLLYTKLAAVNRAFYHVFTSDTVWKNVNPYGIKSGIFRHFASKTADIKQQAHVKLLCSDGASHIRPPRTFDEMEPYLYAWLVRLRTKYEPLNPRGWIEMYNMYPHLVYDICSHGRVSHDFLKVKPLIDDREYAMACYTGNPILFLGDEAIDHRNDLEMVKRVLPLLPIVYRALPESLKTHPEIIRLVLQSPEKFSFAMMEPFKTRVFQNPSNVLPMLRAFPAYIDEFPEYQDNDDVARVVVAVDDDEYTNAVGSLNIKYLSLRLRDSEEFIDYALNYSGRNYFYASERIRSKNIKRLKLKAAQKIKLESYGFPADDDFEHDKEVLRITLFNDPEVLEAAVSKDGRLLRLADDVFKNIDRFAELAVTSDHPYFEVVKDRGRPNRKLALLWLEHSKKLGIDIGDAYNSLDDSNKMDFEVIKFVLSKKVYTPMKIPPQVFEDPEMRRYIVSNFKYEVVDNLSDYFPDEILLDPEVQSIMRQKTPWILKYSDWPITSNEEAIREVFKNPWKRCSTNSFTGRCPMGYIHDDLRFEAELMAPLVAKHGTRNRELLFNSKMFELSIKVDPGSAWIISMMKNVNKKQQYLKWAFEGAGLECIEYIHSLLDFPGWEELYMAANSRARQSSVEDSVKDSMDITVGVGETKAPLFFS